MAKITTFQLPTKKNTSNSNIIAPINLKICKKSTVLHSQIVKNHTFLTSIRQLLLAHEDIDGRSREVPLLANLVLKITTIGLLDPLRQVAEEHKTWNLCIWQLHTELNLDILALD